MLDASYSAAEKTFDLPNAFINHCIYARLGRPQLEVALSFIRVEMHGANSCYPWRLFMSVAL